MGYANTIRGNVKKAFNLLGDLALDVTLSHTANAGFDFATNSTITPVLTTKVIKGVLVERKRERGEKPNSSAQMSFLFKAEDLDDPTVYDTITTIAGAIWRVVPPYSNDGYLITVNVAKEI